MQHQGISTIMHRENALILLQIFHDFIFQLGVAAVDGAMQALMFYPNELWNLQKFQGNSNCIFNSL